jgi:uncharacterized repeat protein (TIGR01451 family)
MRIRLVPAILLAAAAFVFAAPAAAQTRFVATTGADSGTCTNAGTPCRTIQYAHGQAAAGDTISIAAGTYSESPRITKSVTLAGASAATTIIAPQLADQLPGPPPTLPNSAVILDIAGAGITVTVRDLTVRFPSGQYPAAGRNPIVGIWITGGANATVRNTVVTEIHDADVSMVQTGQCIQAGDEDRGAAGTVMIEDNQVSRCQKTGIIANEAGTVATIRNNTVFDGGLGERNAGGPRTATVIAPNGIQIAFGARGAISNNTVRRMQCELPSPQCGGDIDNDLSTAAGILLFDPGTGTTVTGNTVDTTDDAFAPYNPDGALPVVVTGNTFRDNRFRNVVAYSGTIEMARNTLIGADTGLLAVTFGENRQARATLNPANLPADANTIRDARVNGIWVRAFLTPQGAPLGPISMDDESMARATAIVAAARADAPAGVPLPLVEGSRNRFINNLVAGYDNQPDEGTGNLPCNWWGGATGPGVAGANPALLSAGDTVTPFAINNVDYACPANGPAIAVGITKTGPAVANPGGPITWVVTVVNNGPADGAGSIFSDPVPAVITNVTWTCSASSGAACPNAAGSGNNINEVFAVFPPGGQIVYTINGTLPPGAGQYINVATITPTSIPGASAVSASAVVASGLAALPVPTLSGGFLALLVVLLLLATLPLLARRVP